MSRELPGVPQKILHNHLHQALVGIGMASLLDDRLHISVRVCGGEVVEDGTGQSAQVQLFQVQSHAGRAREVKQVVDEVGHLRHGRSKAFQHGVNCIGGRMVGLIVQDVTNIADDIEWPAQIVSDGVGERLELTVGCAELRGALFHAKLQLVSGLLEGHVALLDLGKHLIEGFSEEHQFVVALARVKPE